MALVTLRILDGPERGKIFSQIATPVTIGREEGNFIQLNDERVSRYHMKIHENEGAVILTDLQSTNGTRINGEAVQVWKLRFGDLIMAGRSVLVYGSSEEIAGRLITLKQSDLSAAVPMGVDGEEFQIVGKTADAVGNVRTSHIFSLEIFRGITPEELAPLQLLTPPEPPGDLQPKQAAEMTEFLQYLHLRLRYLVATVKPSSVKGEDAKITLDAAEWQNLLDLYGRIASLLNNVTEP
jgi:hypothetical protein